MCPTCNVVINWFFTNWIWLFVKHNLVLSVEQSYHRLCENCVWISQLPTCKWFAFVGFLTISSNYLFLSLRLRKIAPISRCRWLSLKHRYSNYEFTPLSLWIILESSATNNWKGMHLHIPVWSFLFRLSWTSAPKPLVGLLCYPR